MSKYLQNYFYEKTGCLFGHPVTLSITITCCHSENSEESLIFPRAVVIVYQMNDIIPGVKLNYRDNPSPF